jgi:hypothetical protein
MAIVGFRFADFTTEVPSCDSEGVTECIHSRQTGRQELPQFRVLYLGIQLAVCWRAHREAGLPWTHFWARWTDCQAPAMAPNLFPVGVPPYAQTVAPFTVGFCTEHLTNVFDIGAAPASLHEWPAREVASKFASRRA